LSRHGETVYQIPHSCKSNTTITNKQKEKPSPLNSTLRDAGSYLLQIYMHTLLFVVSSPSNPRRRVRVHLDVRAGRVIATAMADGSENRLQVYALAHSSTFAAERSVGVVPLSAAACTVMEVMIGDAALSGTMSSALFSTGRQKGNLARCFCLWLLKRTIIYQRTYMFN